MNKIFLIGITGGPCAGKTSLFSYALRKLDDFGFKVFIVEEAATQVISTGLEPGIIPQKVFQRFITERICFNENQVLNIVKEWQKIDDRPIVILYDRSHTDTLAYCDSEEQYIELLKEFKLTPEHEVDKFDCVIHMVTAADGAEEFYTLDNNPARYETPEQARIADKKTQQAWAKCSHLRFVDNKKGQSFKEKLRRTMRYICHAVGIPKVVEIERKWIMRRNITKDFLISNGIDVIAEVPITQAYLPNGDRIRKRHNDPNGTFFLTKKTDVSPGVRVETEEMITSDVYHALYQQRDKSCGVIHKKRITFKYKNQWFELDTFDKPSRLQILELELSDINQDVKLPDFLGKITEVTDNPDFFNSNISKRIAQ